VFETRVLRRIFVCKGDEVKWGWKKLHNEELNDLYCSPIAGSIPAGVSDIKSFRSHYGPGVDSASYRNEYQEYFLVGRGGRCVRLTTYHHPVPFA